MLQLMCEGCSYTYPPLSIVRYSFKQLSELQQCRVKQIAQSVNTAAQDSNPGSRSRESEALPLSHCALQSKLYTNIRSNYFWRHLLYRICFLPPIDMLKRLPNVAVISKYNFIRVLIHQRSLAYIFMH